MRSLRSPTMMRLVGGLCQIYSLNTGEEEDSVRSIPSKRQKRLSSMKHLASLLGGCGDAKWFTVTLFATMSEGKKTV